MTEARHSGKSKMCPRISDLTDITHLPPPGSSSNPIMCFIEVKKNSVIKRKFPYFLILVMNEPDGVLFQWHRCKHVLDMLEKHCDLPVVL